MESALLKKIYRNSPRRSRVDMTLAAAHTIYDRKIKGEFTSPDDFALTSLPAKAFEDWILVNDIKILRSRV